MTSSEAHYRRVLAAGFEEHPNPIRVQALLADAKTLDVQQGINSYVFTLAGMLVYPEVMVDDQTVRLGTVNGEELIFSLPALQKLVAEHMYNPSLFNPVDTKLILEKGENRYGTTSEQLPFTTEELLAMHIIALRMQWLALCVSNPDLIWVLQAENVMGYAELVSLLEILPTTVYSALRNS